MKERAAFQHVLDQWQQRDDEELLVETEWIAMQIAQAVEREARVAMQARMRERDRAQEAP